MEAIKIFKNSQFGEIRTALSESGDPLFCLADLCAAIGIANHRNVKTRLEEDDVRQVDTIDSMGRNQEVTFVTESGLYDVIIRSDSEKAKPFRKWVTSEVLPAIRKHGAYMTQSTIEQVLTDPDTLIRLAQSLKEERRQKELAQKQLEYQAPIVRYASEILHSTSGHTSTTIGAELNMSAQTLNKLLIKAKFIRQTGKKGEYSLCASHQGKGYVNTETRKFVRSDDSTGTKIEIRFTEAGRMKIHEIFNKAIAASVIVARKGRYFINYDWKEPEKAA